MTTPTQEPTVWGVFVGPNGDQLEVLNSKNGPFPPRAGIEGYIAIGWPAIGDMRMFEGTQRRGDYLDFVEKFRRIYPPKDLQSNSSERLFKTQANMPWHFAFEVKEEKKDRPGDWVIAPCSIHGLVLVGIVVGQYETDFHDELGFYGRKWVHLSHFRKVRWEYNIIEGDHRYKKLNRIGQLTISRQNFASDELEGILREDRQ
jgi:hypothetical protein